MNTNLRNSGIDVIGDVPWGTHFCQFYQTKEDLMDILVPYFKAGLENNEYCMWVTSKPLGVEEAKEALKKAVPDIDVYLAKGQIEIISYTDWYLKDGIFDSNRVLNRWFEKLNQALANGYDGLRLTGNTFWLEKEDWNNFVDYEEEVDRVLGNYNMIALCTYCLDRCNTNEIIDVVSNHQFALIKREGKWEQIESSKHKLVEEKILKQARLLDLSYDAILIRDSMDHISYWNVGAQEVYGYTKEEALGRIPYELLKTEFPQPLEEIFEMLFRDSRWTGELIHTRKDGRKITVDTRWVLDRDAQGNPVSILEANSDVTERKQTEIALKRKDKHLNDLISSIQDGFFELDREWRYTYINQRAAYNGNFEPEELIGECIWEKFPYMKNSKFEEVYREVMETRQPAHFEVKSIIRDQWYEVNVYPSVSGVSGFWRDITERKQMEDALRKSEERYKMLFTNMTEAFFLAEIIYNEDGKPYDYRFLEVNPAYESLMGIKKEQIIGKSVLEVFPNVSPIALEKSCEVALSSKSLSFENVSYVTGKVFEVYAFSSDKGKLAMIFRDITERKRAEAKIQKLMASVQLEKDRLSALVNSIPDEVWFANTQKKIILVNPSVLKEFGNSTFDNPDVEAIVGSSEVYRPDGIPRPIEEAPPLRALKGEVIVNQEEIVRTPASQELRYRQVNAGPVKDTNGNIIGSVSVVRDITELKQAEERLERSNQKINEILSSIKEDFYVLDPEWNFVYANKQFTSRIGKEPNDFIGNNIWQMFPKHIGTDYEENLRAVMDKGEIRRFEIGSKYTDAYYRMAAFPSAEGITVLGTDITEQKKTEEALRESEKRFKLLSEANALLLSSKDPEKTIQTIAEKVMHYLNCDVFFNYVFDKIQGRLRLNAYAGISEEAAKRIEWLDKGSAICGCVALDGCRIVSEDMQHNGDKRADLVRSMGIQAYACQPLHIGEKTIGTLSFGTKSRKGFTKDELALMSTVADQVSVAIERKQAEVALRESEDKLRALVKNVKSGVALVDETGRFTVVNPSFMQMFGLDNELDILNINSQDWSRWEVYREDGKLLHVDDHPVRKAGMTGKPVKDQLVAVRNPGANELTWMLISAEPVLKEDGQIYMMICTYHDITERKQAEDVIKTAAINLARAERLASLGHWDWDLTTNKVKWSDGHFRIFGYAVAHDTETYEMWRARVHPEDIEAVEKALQKGMEKDRGYNMNYRIILPDGSIRYIHAEANKPIKDASGKPIRWFGIVQDTTEQKLADEALRESEARRKVAEAVEIERKRLFDVLETLPAMICLLTPDHHYAFTNHSFREKFGNCGGRHCYECCFGLNKPCEFCEAYKVLETGEPHHWEVTTPDGCVIDVYNYPFTDFDGSPLILEMNIDITQRKKVEEALKLSSIYNRSLIEASLDPLVTIGHDGKITDINKATEFVTGYSRDELIGTDFIDYFTEPEKARSGYQQVFTYGEVRDYPLDIQHKDGHITPVLYNASVYKDENGEVIGVFAAARDISELKKAQEKIKNLAGAVESSNDAIITQSLDGIITSWNKGAEQIYGYSSEEVLGKDVSILEPDNLKGEIKQLIEKTKHGEKVQHYETLRLKKDGTIINTSVTLSPIYDATGKFASISCIARDITKRKKAEKILKLKLEELQRSNDELEQFAYVSSHDLQEPLRMISSYLQLLQRRYQGKIDEKADKYIYYAVDGAARMQTLINDLLEFSKVSTRAREPEPTDCEFVLNQVLSNLDLYIKKNKATVTHDPLPEVMADNTQLAQVFQNLIANGIKFHGQEAPKIHISAEKKEREWQFSVRDNGIGIDSQYSQKIFEVFKRLHKKEEYPGTGIGLAICKKIVERHSGHIWVESELDKGATFYFTLPINPVAVSKTNF